MLNSFFRNALVVILAHVPLIPCWHVMVQTTISTAKDVMQKGLELMDMGLDVAQRFFKLLTCKYQAISYNHRRVRLFLKVELYKSYIYQTTFTSL